jgi:hypothetical protein
MSESLESKSAFPQLPIRERAIEGVKSGLIIGVYFAVLLAIYSAIVRSPQSEFLSHPVVGVLRTVLAFAIAGSVFRVLQPTVTNTLGAVAVGILCTFIAVIGLTTALRGSRPSAYLAALVLGVLGGTIGAVIMWRGWYRQASRASST